MKQNLKSALERKGISNRAVCELLSISEKSLYNKITGATDFTVSEALMIMRNLLPEYTMEYLFMSSDAA